MIPQDQVGSVEHGARAFDDVSRLRTMIEIRRTRFYPCSIISIYFNHGHRKSQKDAQNLSSHFIHPAIGEVEL
jgi:hypothetical protein